jgi:hypothetical protein
MKKQDYYLVFITDMFGSDMGFLRSVPGNSESVRISSFPDGLVRGEEMEDEGDGRSVGDEI